MEFRANFAGIFVDTPDVLVSRFDVGLGEGVDSFHRADLYHKRRILIFWGRVGLERAAGDACGSRWRLDGGCSEKSGLERLGGEFLGCWFSAFGCCD